MYLVMFVLHDCELLSDLLDSWEEAGVGGVTILHSSGLGRVRRDTLMDDLPLMPSLEALFQHEEYFSRTLFSVIDGEDLIEKILQATEKVVGDLEEPDTGLLLVIPVHKVYGLNKNYLPKE